MCHRLPMQPFYQASGDRLASSTTDGCPHQTFLLDHPRKAKKKEKKKKEKKRKRKRKEKKRKQWHHPPPKGSVGYGVLGYPFYFPLSPALSFHWGLEIESWSRREKRHWQRRTKLRLGFGAGAACRCAPFPKGPNGRETEVQGVATEQCLKTSGVILCPEPLPHQTLRGSNCRRTEMSEARGSLAYTALAFLPWTGPELLRGC
ncbi:hypothetical protein BO78DRAFT_196981 [Aspergillus sclerotiicarbonarius CBS 121057]|uniref:Uncharacterized protein n=1 Tax=Aspergillus sclerotiicarbonarius (strain CBS 121057 / IBT 28362) TaxID=1448318 RepID=A0A319DZX4_ASPSB|nr:hypothetical protein BO78DRAFT_196981 [Aspergillus sclerotiicarbonarius CBS 121057]